MPKRALDRFRDAVTGTVTLGKGVAGQAVRVAGPAVVRTTESVLSRIQGSRRSSSTAPPPAAQPSSTPPSPTPPTRTPTAEPSPDPAEQPPPAEAEQGAVNPAKVAKNIPRKRPSAAPPAGKTTATKRSAPGAKLPPRKPAPDAETG